ncbi:hypothetical protein ACFE04_025792 [Oxalis oulophora]
MEPLFKQSSEGEVILKIKSNNKNNNNVKFSSNSTTTTTPSKNVRLSFDQVLNQVLSQKDEILSSNSSSFSRQAASRWRSVVTKTKSRLLDLEEEYDQTSNIAAHHHEDVEDMIPEVEDDKKAKLSTWTVIQWASLVFIIMAFICSLSIPLIKNQRVFDLPLWKWESLLLTLISAELVSDWGIRLLVIFMERNFLLRKRVLYFVYGLRKGVRNSLWLALVLLVWHLICYEESKSSLILPFVTKILFCFFIGNFIWLLKTVIVKVLASTFHVQTFFDRIQEALFNQYVIDALSGPPLLIETPNDQEILNINTLPGDHLKTPLLARGKLQNCPKLGKKSIFSSSAWNMKRIINIIHDGTLDEQILDSDHMKDESWWQIKSQGHAKEAAKIIFHKLAKAESEYIYVEDMMRFMGKDEAMKAMHNIKQVVCEINKEGISKSLLKIWLVKVYREGKLLGYSLNDTKTSVDEVHNILNVIVGMIIAIVWLVILGVPITHFLVLVSSQLLLVVFIFGNTCKTVFEAIIFLFIMHPFDVGDPCEIDGIQMRVEEMNILTTVFLRSDNQKVSYPNSVLATKVIGNFHRSPDMMETINFCIHISTPIDNISLMKQRLIEYVTSKSEHWHNTPMVVVTDLEDMNRLNIALWLRHRLNYERVVDRWKRRGLVIEQIVKVCRDLQIEYRLDIQIIHRLMMHKQIFLHKEALFALRRRSSYGQIDPILFSLFFLSNKSLRVKSSLSTPKYSSSYMTCAKIQAVANENQGKMSDEEDDLCPVDCVREFKTDDELSEILDKASETDALVVVDFYRTSCGSCKYIEQGFSKLCKGSGDQNAPVIFLKHNVLDEYDEQSEVAERLRIKSVPLFHFYKKGVLVEAFATRDRERIDAAILKYTSETVTTDDDDDDDDA